MFDTKKGTQRKRKDDESKKHKKNKRSTHKRDDCDEIVKIELKFHTILVFICGHTPFPKKDILLYFLCALL